MESRRIGIILNGVTGRMGMNQHLERSIMAIRQQGGVKADPRTSIMPEPILVGRNTEKLKALSQRHGGIPYSTDLDSLLDDSKYSIYFDAQTTPLRFEAVSKALAAGKHVYCEKPVATTSADAMELVRRAEKAGLKNGVVQDKLWLPGIRKLRHLIDTGFFGRILSVRGEFGYWVFTGEDQPAQRPSWNYRAEDGGGIIIDMLCHWRYLVDNLFGNVTSVSCLGATHIDHRIDEEGRKYKCTADDSAYATMITDQNIVCHFNSSWCVRVRRDDLLTLQVDGTKGSAVAGLRECRAQPASRTPRPVWNPDIDSPIDFYADWQKAPANQQYDNAFKAQWELFLRHVALGEPFGWTLREAAKGVQLAELGIESWNQRRWMDVPELS
ncbi:MAG TPA: Gfo/Idh/MocA family oxidoreductase [Tepidisphaeraceae bacterium]|jgi:predicted dehydrogenase|nr:Gfo/Idh/MocA family oxidoreductase [Tepidisphaeraceae bacterium]